MGEFLKSLGGLVVKALSSEEFMESVIALAAVYGVRVIQKNRRYQIAAETTVDVVDYIEEHYKDWGIKGSQKLDKFVELFVKEFRKVLGKNPTKQEIESAKLKAEAQVQRARRAVVTKK